MSQNAAGTRRNQPRSTIKLVHAVASECGDNGCIVELVDGGTKSEATYSEPMIGQGITVHPDDLLAVETTEERLRSIYRFAAATVIVSQGEGSVEADGPNGLVQGLIVNDYVGEMVPGQTVFVAEGKIVDVALERMSAHSQALGAATFPTIEAR